MTVHMFQIAIGRGKMSVSDLEAAMNDWVQAHAEWDGQPATFSEWNTELDGSGATYYATQARFIMDDTKDNLVQKATDKLKNKVAWYRLHYHVCDHDEDDRAACPWTDRREWTAKDATIPAGVPNLEVEA